MNMRYGLLSLSIITIALHAMKEKTNNQPLIEGYIAIQLSTPIYAGQCKAERDYITGKNDIDLRKILNDRSIEANDLLQSIYAWSPGEIKNSFYGTTNNRYFPWVLPYNRLKNIKEGDILEITIDGALYKLIANQHSFNSQKKMETKKILKKHWLFSKNNLKKNQILKMKIKFIYCEKEF